MSSADEIEHLTPSTLGLIKNLLSGHLNWLEYEELYNKEMVLTKEAIREVREYSKLVDAAHMEEMERIKGPR